MKVSEQKSRYGLAVFIGRMQPMHNGHLAAIKTACESAQKVLILVGSSNAAPSTKNPFTADWRIEVAREVIADKLPEHATKVVFERLPDLPTNSAWVKSVWLAINRNYPFPSLQDTKERTVSAALVGCRKGDNHFLNWFPEIDFIEVPPFMPAGFKRPFSATFLREEFIFKACTEYIYSHLAPYMPGKACAAVSLECKSERFQLIKQEFDYLEDYKASRSTKYPINDVTADAFVFCKDHVLLISRGRKPGAGLLALPGGFVNTDESIQQAALRELHEETGLKLLPCFVDSQVFDNPSRSQRGRIITHVYAIQLQPNIDGSLPNVNAGDDASRADWYPINMLFNPENAAVFFEDHYEILLGMVKRQPCLFAPNSASCNFLFG